MALSTRPGRRGEMKDARRTDATYGRHESNTRHTGELPLTDDDAIQFAPSRLKLDFARRFTP